MDPEILQNSHTYNTDVNVPTLNFCKDLGKVFDRCIYKIDELDNNGKLLISAYRRKIKFGYRNKFNNLGVKYSYSYFYLNDKKDAVICYHLNQMCTFSIKDSKVINFKILFSKNVKDIVQVNDQYVLTAFYNINYIQVDYGVILLIELIKIKN